MTKTIFCFTILFTCSCSTTERYVIDLSKVEDFNWNGNMRITYQDYGFLRGWKVDHVELCSNDGSAVSVNTSRTKPDVLLIGDPKSHRSAKVLFKNGGWLIQRSEVKNKSFHNRVDLADKVDPQPFFARGNGRKKSK